MRPLGSPLRHRGYTGTAPTPKPRKRLEYGIAYSQPRSDGYTDYQVKQMRDRNAAQEELADIEKWTTIEGAHLVVREVSPWRSAAIDAAGDPR